ncbi:polyprenyl synthetase family protein [Microvirga tunisiensis]|uniref:Probable farnesyl diphosphate synthase n=1 Tax=Pannonibacter tanglangensis TaxID=2750084 RepID=A0A7X5F5V6_9HYPH|nr:polyprenyl synthetase family protein [Pannonibacter sp. XCT-53]
MSWLDEALRDMTQRMDVAIRAALSPEPRAGELMRPERLLAAMQHGTLNGGKRLRPLLMSECAAAFGRADDGVLVAAAALECLHSYSLVHDDLPAMDDDDLRRGQPTVHKAFDEATAILAGDSLLTLAFDLIAEPSVHPDAAVRLRLSQDLARAAGVGGMAGGQMLDLQAEHRTLGEEEIRTLQAMKTGALLRYACEAGARLGNASPEDVARLRRYGEVIGLAFQLADDLLDLEATPEVMGKATGKDAEAGKATLVSLYGADRTRQILAGLVEEATTLVAGLGPAGERLAGIAAFVAFRSH